MRDKQRASPKGLASRPRMYEELIRHDFKRSLTSYFKTKDEGVNIS